MQTIDDIEITSAKPSKKKVSLPVATKLIVTGFTAVSIVWGINVVDVKTREAQQPAKCDKTQWSVPVPRTHIAVPSYFILSGKEEEPYLKDWLAVNHPEIPLKAVADANAMKPLSKIPSTSGGIKCLKIPGTSAATVTKSSLAGSAAASMNLPAGRIPVTYRTPSTLTDKQIVALAYNAGFRGDSLVKITAIALAESKGRTNAICRNTGNGCGAKPGTELSIDYGVVQINLKAHNVSMADAGDPATAMKLAYKISKKGKSFRPWVTYWRGHHNKFIPRAISAAKDLNVY